MAFAVRGISNRQLDQYDASDPFDQPAEEPAPFLKALLIALVPALLCWAAIIGAAFSIWRRFAS